MLSTSEIKNVGQASHYFAAKDNYYSQEEGIQKSEWWGKGAVKLNLEGTVESDQFTALLQGKLPNGEQLGKMVDGELKHRAGWDLTLSVPKSVSMLALIGNDKRLLEAHQHAVNVTLSHIERGCSQARAKTQDGVVYQNTGNMVAALFHHDLSRAQDPQLHTHCVVLNMTERSDGKWRSQASQIGRYGEDARAEVNGFIERVRHHKRYYGQLYRAEIAYQVRQLGYELEVDKKSGFFEIAGVSREIIEQFSKRREDIEKYMESNDLVGGKASAVATLKTRESKKEADRGQLSQEWQQRANQHGFDYQQLVDTSLSNQHGMKISNKLEMPNQIVKAMIEKASHDTSVFQSSFTLEDLVMKSSEYAVKQGVSVEAILTGVDQAITNGDLITLANDQGKTLLMAKETLNDEARLIEGLKNNKLHDVAMTDQALTNYLAQQDDLTIAQESALRSIFAEDRIVFLEGKESKNQLAEHIVKIARSNYSELMIVSPNKIGSKTFARLVKPQPKGLWEEIKALFLDNTPQHASVMEFLSKANENRYDKPPKIVLVDNAHLLSTYQKSEMVTWSINADAKLILLGDKHSLLPRLTGGMIDQLTDHGVKTITLSQHEKSKFDVSQLSERVVQLTDKDERLHAMATHYSKVDVRYRAKSWLVTHNQANVAMLNQYAHDVLKEKNQVHDCLQVMTLIPVFVSDNKKTLATTYKKDMMIRFNEPYPSLGIDRGDYLKALRYSKASNRVVLQNESGSRIIWQPDKIAGNNPGKIEIFTESKQEVGIGEAIMLNRSIYDLKLVKGERVTVHNIYNNKLIVKDSAGKKSEINLSKQHHRHINYGYAARLHDIAHDQPETLIAEFVSRSHHANQRHISQAVLQAKETWIYTDSISQLSNQLSQNTGDKLSAHDLIKRSDEIKKNLHSLHHILEQHLSVKNGTHEHTTSIKSAIDAVDYAIHHLAEREAGFSHKDVMQVALSHALGEVKQETLNDAILAMDKAGIMLKGHQHDGTLWTTHAAVKMEREIIDLCQKDIGVLTPITTDHLVASHCEQNNLNLEQTKAVKSIVQGKDRIMTIQGYAGTGKTTMLATVNAILHDTQDNNGKPYQLLGLAPTHTAVKELSNRGIEAKTLDSFLVEMKQIDASQFKTNPNLILVIDESSMVSNRKMLEILKMTSQLDCRAIVMGDIRQLPSIESGKPHALIQAKIEPIRMQTIKRQQDPMLIKAVSETINYDFEAAFATLKNSIVEFKPENDGNGVAASPNIQNELRMKRISQMVSDYMHYPKEQRDNIQVITPGHDDRALANALIRNQLLDEGTLNGDRITSQILVSRNMTSVEASHATNFERGEVIRFGQSASAEIKSGDYLTIVDSDKRHNLLTLKREDGKLIVWQVPTFDKRHFAKIEVFKAQTRDVCVGDMIQWSRSDKKNELYSADRARVIGIEHDKMTIMLGNGKTVSLNPSQRACQHWDHGYASTVYAAQGKTKDIVLAHLESFRENLTNQPAFLVALTRAVNEFKIYTDDADKLLSSVQKNTGMKLSSLEVIGEYPQSPLKNQSIASKTKMSKKEITTPKYDRYMIANIKERLNHDAEQIAISILGEPKARVGNQLRFGRNQGSLVVTVKGEKQGWWHDFSSSITGESGGRDMLSFIKVHTGMDKREVIQYAAKRVGLDPSVTTLKHDDMDLMRTQKPKEPRDKTQTQDEKKRIQFAKKLASQSQPAKATLVDRYLKDHRGIHFETLPKDIRFHPGIYSKLNDKMLPAMLVIARNQAGQIKAVQATYLDEKTGGKIAKSDVQVQKQTFGVLHGASVSIQQNKNAPTLLAEGTETGLSLAKALPDVHVHVMLGKANFLNIDTKQVTDKVILCLDNDGKDMRSDPIVSAVAKRLADHGKQVGMMMPETLQATKQDYNDVLRLAGTDAIQADYGRAIKHIEFENKANTMVKMQSISHEISLI